LFCVSCGDFRLQSVPIEEGSGGWIATSGERKAKERRRRGIRNSKKCEFVAIDFEDVVEGRRFAGWVVEKV
jgi:hypothetical protein